MPQTGDSVYIPAGQIITVKGTIFTADAFIHMVVAGTLDFEPSGKLDLAQNSTLQILSNGKITSDNNNSEVIRMGGITKFQGAVDPSPLNGPMYASDATGNSPSGFVYGTLAVNIHGFGTRIQNGRVLVSWKSSGETNIRSYSVERRMEGNQWETIKTVAAHGVASSYEIADPAPAKGNNFYRLRTTELNGTQAYSTVARLLSLHPFEISSLRQDRGMLHVTMEGSRHSRLQVQLMAMDGKLITQAGVPVINNKVQVDISSIPTGVYLIGFTDPEQNRVVSKFQRY